MTINKKFCLNDKRLKRQLKAGAPSWFYRENDVKEFVRQLKDEFVLDSIAKKDVYRISALTIHRIIDKLAGENLI